MFPLFKIVSISKATFLPNMSQKANFSFAKH